MTKKKAQRRHAFNRAVQRFGFNLSQKQQDAICQRIRAGTATFVVKQSNRVSVWDVEHRGEVLRVVYDNQRRSLATVMTPDMTPSPVFADAVTDS